MSVEPLYTVPDPLLALTSIAQRDGAIASWTTSSRGYTKADIYCMWAVRVSKVLTLSQRPGKHGIAPFPVLSDASEHTSKEHM